jgi:hypothetical protein
MIWLKWFRVISDGGLCVHLQEWVSSWEVICNIWTLEYFIWSPVFHHRFIIQVPSVWDCGITQLGGRELGIEFVVFGIWCHVVWKCHCFWGTCWCYSDWKMEARGFSETVPAYQITWYDIPETDDNTFRSVICNVNVLHNPQMNAFMQRIALCVP